jgi:hypothetical protein
MKNKMFLVKENTEKGKTLNCSGLVGLARNQEHPNVGNDDGKPHNVFEPPDCHWSGTNVINIKQ